MSENSAPQAGPAYAYGVRLMLVIALLAAVGLVNNVDRVLLAVLTEPVRHDLGFNDSQIGLLSGLIFAVFYTLMAIPLAWLADRYSRSLILAWCITLWSLSTAYSGLAQSFSQMAIARIGVATGEAGATPITHALVMRYAAPHHRGRALSIVGAGVAAGSMLGLMVGGALEQSVGWRHTFFIMALPGIVLAVILAIAMRDKAVPDREATRIPRISTMALAKLLFRNRAFVTLCAVAVLSTMGVTALTAWKAAFVMRAFGLPIAFVGLWVGLVSGFSSIAGNLLGGYLSGRSSEPATRGPGICMMVGAIAYILCFLSPTWPLMLVFLGLGGVMTSVWYGPLYANVQRLAPEQSRSQASAIVLFLTGSLGISIGATTIGVISDFLSPSLGVGGLRVGLCLMSTMIAIAGMLMVSVAKSLPGMQSVSAIDDIPAIAGEA